MTSPPPDRSVEPSGQVPRGTVCLGDYDNRWYRPGRGRVGLAAWYLAGEWLVSSRTLPWSGYRSAVLSVFGARVGRGVVVKPGVRVKYPWRLTLGDDSWIGEDAWLDSLAPISIGPNVCVSQGAYLCTGNHDWSDTAFGLVVREVVIEEGAWVGAKALILPGVVVATHSVIKAGAVVTRSTEPYGIYEGNPAVVVGTRVIEPGRRTSRRDWVQAGG